MSRSGPNSRQDCGEGPASCRSKAGETIDAIAGRLMAGKACARLCLKKYKEGGLKRALHDGHRSGCPASRQRKLGSRSESRSASFKRLRLLAQRIAQRACLLAGEASSELLARLAGLTPFYTDEERT